MSQARLSNDLAPILEDKVPDVPSAFTSENLLREAHRQKGLPGARVPDVRILDPDGDFVADLVRSGRVVRDPTWACYTVLQVVEEDGLRLGFIGGAIERAMRDEGTSYQYLPPACFSAADPGP